VRPEADPAIWALQCWPGLANLSSLGQLRQVGFASSRRNDKAPSGGGVEGVGEAAAE